ncbi:transcriptional regulator, DeoR family [Cyclobacterium lianum]|uniref:Transcriptional regulator, DeoR family n=1 Tax=Cyclobacterium lianum TaxID=388280 RepID=A0A1M7JNE0_9BACT|nr:DeoR/GlpR family DNA-binding transcription regulator [Cyclobacterium lianum]SHM54421.1 transcriptional regulator, DeoR family [Cyclobacterium lianum]
MVIAERHKYILDQLKSAGYVSVAALSKAMNVTMVTVRKDLKILEDKGLLFRSHGSATPVAPYVMDKPVDEKQWVQVEQKRAIAQQAIKLLKQEDAIIIGSGTTVLAFAQAIPRDLSLTVLTGALNVSIALLDLHKAEIVQLGGVVRQSSSSVVGHFAESMINQFACSKLFISVDGIDAEFGLTTSNMMEAHLNSTMIRSVQKTIVLADSSKFGKKSFGKIANIEDVDTIISDRSLSRHYVNLLEDKGVEVMLV